MYRTVDVRFWSDPKVRKLPPDSKLLFLYLITNPHTHVSGIYYLPDLMMEHESGLAKKNVTAALATLTDAGLVKCDHNHQLVWVVKMMSYQGKGDRIERAAAKHVSAIHESHLVGEFLEQYPSVRMHVSCDLEIPHTADVSKCQIPYSPADSTCAKEQEQEQEKYQEQKKTPPPPKGAVKEIPIPENLDTIPFREAWDEWKQFRREKRNPLTPLTVKKQLKMLQGLGERGAINCIEKAIRNGYTGLWPDKNGIPKAEETEEERQARIMEKVRQQRLRLTQLEQGIAG